MQAGTPNPPQTSMTAPVRPVPSHVGAAGWAGPLSPSVPTGDQAGDTGTWQWYPWPSPAERPCWAWLLPGFGAASPWGQPHALPSIPSIRPQGGSGVPPPIPPQHLPLPVAGSGPPYLWSGAGSGRGWARPRVLVGGVPAASLPWCRWVLSSAARSCPGAAPWGGQTWGRPAGWEAGARGQLGRGTPGAPCLQHSPAPGSGR